MSLPSPQSDLTFTALRYLAGELDGVDTDAFERRLATDESAQRALVEAVQLSAAIQTTAPAVRPATRVAVARQPQRTSRWSGAAALVGTALVAATVLIALRNEPEPAVAVVSSDEANSGATVSLWTSLDVDEIESALDDSSLFESDGEAADAVQVPDWMFAAIESDFATSDQPVDPATESSLEATDKDS